MQELVHARVVERLGDGGQVSEDEGWVGHSDAQHAAAVGREQGGEGVEEVREVSADIAA